MRNALHALLVILMAPLLFVAWLAVSLAALLATWADRVRPDAGVGNCWSYALAKFRRDGGYVVCRPVSLGRMFAGIGSILHVFWVADVEGKDLRQTIPKQRYTGPWLILRCWYFPYRIETTEPARRGKWRNNSPTV